MSSEAVAGGGLKQIKTSIDQVLSILLEQSNKQSENELLLRSLSNKFDMQNQRLMLLESDLKVVKETLEQKSEITESPILSRSPSELKQVVKSIQDLDRGVRAVENSTNGLCLVLKDLQDHLPAMKQLKTAVQTIEKLKGADGQVVNKDNLVKCVTHGIEKVLTEKLGQIMSRGELTTNVSVLKESIHKNNFSIENVQKNLNENLKYLETMKGSLINGIGLLGVQNQKIFDQTIAECQIVRELIDNTRKTRWSYKCDFYVREFSKCREQYSQAWFIDQFNTHVKGHVSFRENNTQMMIRLVQGSYPRILGLNTQDQEGPSCSVSVKLVKEGKRSWQVGFLTDCGFGEETVVGDGWKESSGYRIACVATSP